MGADDTMVLVEKVCFISPSVCYCSVIREMPLVSFDPRACLPSTLVHIQPKMVPSWILVFVLCPHCAHGRGPTLVSIIMSTVHSLDLKREKERQSTRGKESAREPKHLDLYLTVS